MNEVFVICNQDGHYWGKSKEWVDGSDRRAVMRVKHRDEATNTLFELSSKDFELRGDVLEAPANDKGEPMVSVSDIPLPSIPVADEQSASAIEENAAQNNPQQRLRHPCKAELADEWKNLMSEQPAKSRLVMWAGYLALSLLTLLPISVLIVRSGSWQQGLMLYALCSAGAALLLLLFILLLLLPAYRSQRSSLVKSLLLTLPGSLLVLSIFTGGDYPAIHDISTDTQNPPEFVTAAKARGEGSNPLSIKPDSIAAQLKAYPDITTLRSNSTPAEAFSNAIASAEALGWEVYHRDAEAGVIEALDTTTIMGFKDDIVIRILPDPEQTRVDLRSVSRVGRGDMGANAKRIRAFSQQFQQ